MSDDTDIKLSLIAGDEVTIPAVGSYFRIIEASAAVSVAVEDGPMVKRYQGMGQGRATQFSRLRLKSDINQFVHVAVTDGRVDDSRLSVNAPIIVDVGATLGNGALSVGVAAMEALPAAPARRSVFLWNNSTTATLYVGSSAAVTAANGWPIAPKSGLILDKAAAAPVWVISSAAATDARYLTESD